MGENWHRKSKLLCNRSNWQLDSQFTSIGGGSGFRHVNGSNPYTSRAICIVRFERLKYGLEQRRRKMHFTSLYR